MTFSQKSTARNLFRYKKRFLMTVLGIGGCMGLLLVGFGLKDSIMAIGEKQFGEIRVYSATLTLEDDCSDEEREAILDEIRADDDVTALHGSSGNHGRYQHWRRDQEFLYGGGI